MACYDGRWYAQDAAADKVLNASIEEYMYTVSAERGGAGDGTYVAKYDIPRRLILVTTMHDSSIAGTVRTVY